MYPYIIRRFLKVYHGHKLISLLAPRNELQQVGPAEACRVTGWKDLPHVGDVIMEVSKGISCTT
jgi:hypothetical protein